jgi:dTDP-4-dehydrorhamnose 3,5-epimerase
VQIRELSIADSYAITPVQHVDDRGVFLEWYRFDALEEVIGHPLTLRQANTSVSKRGVVRGIHYADTPIGQAKYVTVTRGAVMDFVVDLRVGSSTFGAWDSAILDDVTREALYISEGLGHAFVALTGDATVSYLVSGVYDPVHEHGINPLDAQIALEFPKEAGELLLSPKDTDAFSLEQARTAGVLPEFSQVQDFYRSLNTSES